MLSTICKLLPLLTCIGYTSANHQVTVIIWNGYNNGPARNLLCGFQHPCNTCSYKWIFGNKTLAVDNMLDADPSRYHVMSGICHQRPDLCGSLLEITNLVKDDEGSYTCEVRNGTHVSQGVGKVVGISEYLPSPMYPQCSLHPGPKSNTGEISTVTFTCIGGHASPPVNLTLAYQTQDGPEEILTTGIGNMSVARGITPENNNDIFICHMRSQIFTDFYRNCFADFVTVISKTEQNTSFGPILSIYCSLISGFCTSCTYRWIFGGKILAENDKLIEADPLRYSVWHKYNYPQRGVGNLLQITNLMKEDAGVYECQLVDHLTNNTILRSTSTSLTFYLPASDYPKCSISPSTDITAMTNVTFTCISGMGLPITTLNLNLTLQSQNNSSVELRYGVGDITVIRTLTSADDNATFVCEMTSETFPTAYRKCSIGPVTVTKEKSTGTSNRISPTTLGGSIGAVILVLIIVIICSVFLVRKVRSKSSHSAETTNRDTNTLEIPLYVQVQKNREPENHQSNEAEDGGLFSNAFYAGVAKQVEPAAVPNPDDKSNSPQVDHKSDVCTSNQEPIHKQDTSSGQIPLYAQVKKKTAQTSLSNNMEDDAISSDTTMPGLQPAATANENSTDESMYSQVQKKTKPQNTPSTSAEEEAMYSYASVPGLQPAGADIPQIQTKTSALNSKDNDAMYSYASVPGFRPTPGANPNQEEDESNIPVYGKVNKGYKADTSNGDAGNRESSGMVDNIIYVSSDSK